MKLQRIDMKLIEMSLVAAMLMSTSAFALENAKELIG